MSRVRRQRGAGGVGLPVVMTRVQMHGDLLGQVLAKPPDSPFA